MGDIQERRVVFYVTGFGVFHCSGSMLDINPTDYLVQQIQRDSDEFSSIQTNFLKVSEVSAIDSLQTLLDLQICYKNEKKEGDISVFLHLGVSGKAIEFTLEEYAYNQSQWYGPDSRGWIAETQQIKKGTPEKIQCQIPNLQTLCDLQCTNFPCCMSDDPGRYLCNFIYYHSLLTTQQEKDTYSLFVHVPLFGLIPATKQVTQLAVLLRNVSLHLQNSTTQ